MNKKYMIIGGAVLSVVVAGIVFFNLKSPSLKSVLSEVK